MLPSIGDLPDRSEKVWFSIEDGAHAGPFSYEQLRARPAVRLVWAKGWPASLPFETLKEAYAEVVPPLPAAEEPPPPLLSPPAGRRARATLFAAGVISVGIGGAWWFHLPKLERPAELPLMSFREAAIRFAASERPLPLPWIGVRADYGRLWLLDRSSQSCHFEVTLRSDPKQNLSGQEVVVQARGVSFDHWVPLERWEYGAGERLWPGRYRLTVVRRDCLPQGLRRWWQAPDPAATLHFELPVSAGGAADLERRLAQRRIEEDRKLRRARTAMTEGWRDIEEKCRTLAAISLQIEQEFQLLLNRKRPWPARVKEVVSRYTLRFGGFLTNFVVKNDEDFSRLAQVEREGKTALLAEQPRVNQHAKRIGLLSMTLIEGLQKSPPSYVQLQKRLATLSKDLAIVREALELQAREAQQTYTAPEF